MANMIDITGGAGRTDKEEAVSYGTGIAPAVTLMASSAPVVDISEKVLSVKEIFDEIMEELGIDAATFGSIPALEHMEYNGVKIKIGEPLFASANIVFAIFVGAAGDQLDDHVNGDVRIFTRPSVATSAKTRDWFFYTYNRTSLVGATKMGCPQKAWVEMVANEFEGLGVSLGVLEGPDGDDADEGDDEA